MMNDAVSCLCGIFGAVSTELCSPTATHSLAWMIRLCFHIKNSGWLSQKRRRLCPRLNFDNLVYFDDPLGRSLSAATRAPPARVRINEDPSRCDRGLSIRGVARSREHTLGSIVISLGLSTCDVRPRDGEESF